MNVSNQHNVHLDLSQCSLFIIFVNYIAGMLRGNDHSELPHSEWALSCHYATITLCHYEDVN